MVATVSRILPSHPRSDGASDNYSNSAKQHARQPSTEEACGLKKQDEKKEKTVTRKSPQIVENTLKEFREYLKLCKESLQLQQQHEHQQSHRQEHHQPSDDDTYATCGDYSWYKHQPQTGNETNNQVDILDNNKEATARDVSTTVWDASHTKEYLKRLSKFHFTLVEQIDRFPLQSQAGRDVLTAIQSAATRGTRNLFNSSSIVPILRHVSQMAIYVSKLLSEIQLVDLDRLILLMKLNKEAGEAMTGKDVILLCGAARSGKTTTLHYMAGSTLKEVEVEGFFHLQPTRVKQSALKNYKTACSDREPVTDHLQTASVDVGGQEVVICDTPGLGNDVNESTVELDIANGLGMVRAFHQAKSIRPVVVLSRDEVQVRERFSSDDGDSVACISRLLGKSREFDLAPLNYVFTKYESKHQGCLHKQFLYMLQNHYKKDSVSGKSDELSIQGVGLQEQESKTQAPMFPREIKMTAKILEDIAAKVTPAANIVLPLEGKYEKFVQNLWNNTHSVKDPAAYFVPFVDFASLKKLQLQLRVTLSDLRTSLVEDDPATAVYRLRQLEQLAEVLPEAKDCATLGEQAVKKHLDSLWEKTMASLERKNTSMALSRAQQMVNIAKALPEVKTYAAVTYNAVVLLKELNTALSINDPKQSNESMKQLTSIANEYPEANKCAIFALKASMQHITAARDNTTSLVGAIHRDNIDIQEFISLVKKLHEEMCNIIQFEPLLLSCVKGNFTGLESEDTRCRNKVAERTSEAFCIDEIQRLTDALKLDLPDFKTETVDMDELLKRKEKFLSSLERLKVISIYLKESPAGARAESIYHQAFQDFHDFISSLIKEAEDNYKSNWTDLNVFGEKTWLVAILLQGPLKNRPHTKRREHIKVEALERRVLKLMLRFEIEINRSMDQLKTFKFPEYNYVRMNHSHLIPEFGISEMKAPRFLLISVAKNARIQKMLPTPVDILEINVCVHMFDHALLNFWKKAIIRIEQDYAVIVAMQKLKKEPQEILKIAHVLQSDITRIEKEFLDVCGWSDDLTSESQADLKRLLSVRDCVHTGVSRLEELVKSYSRGFFACGGLDNVSGNFFCTNTR